MLKDQKRGPDSPRTSNKNMFSLAWDAKEKKEKSFGKTLDAFKENILRCPNLGNPFP